MRARLLWLLLAACPVVTPAHAATWRVAETEHFRVYSNGSAKSLADQAAVLEDYRALLGSLTTRRASDAPEPKLDIFLLGSLAEARPFGTAPAGAAGFYSANDGRIAAYVERGGALGSDVLLHEYAHHFMLGSGAIAYPAWYVEGFAEYFMTAEFTPDRINFGKFNENRARWLVNGTWLSLEKVLARRFKPTDREDMAMFYAQSWLLTHYMFRAEGMLPKLTAYLRAVTSGTDPVTAFKTHVDPDLTAFQYKLKTYLQGRKLTYSRFDRSEATPATVKLSELPASADPMLLQQAALEFGVMKGEEARALAKVRADAARFPGDPLAARTLALAELRYGDRNAAVGQIDTLLQANPADPTLLRWRAVASLPATPPAPAETLRDARRLLAKSFKADPDDWRTLMLYAQLADPRNRALSPNDLDVLLRARDLAPQVGSLSIMSAIALAQADRLPEAARMLEPLAYSPHGGAGAARVAEAMEKAKAGDKVGFLAFFKSAPADAD
jgi:hypothetical protein